MRLESFLFTFLAVATTTTTLVVVNAIEMLPPVGDDCWTSSTALLYSEITALLSRGFDPTIERKYVFCSHTNIKIAALVSGQQLPLPDPNINYADAIGIPILVMAPNLHLYCKENCTLTMVDETTCIFAPTTGIVNVLGLVPTGLEAAVIDHLTIDGFTFSSNASSISNANGSNNGVVTLATPGENITIRNCHFTTVVGIGGWGIAAEYHASEDTMNRTDGLYQAITIEDCTFSDSFFDRAAIVSSSFSVDEAAPKDIITHDITVRRCTFTNNSITGGSATFQAADLLAFGPFVTTTLEDNCFIDNETPSGSIATIQGNDVTLVNNFESGTMQTTIISTTEDGTNTNSTTLMEENCLGGILLLVDHVATNDESAFECIPLTATFCSNEEADSMTPSTTPSDMPSIVPSDLPSNVPSDLPSFLPTPTLSNNVVVSIMPSPPEVPSSSSLSIMPSSVTSNSFTTSWKGTLLALHALVLVLY